MNKTDANVELYDKDELKIFNYLKSNLKVTQDIKENRVVLRLVLSPPEGCLTQQPIVLGVSSVAYHGAVPKQAR